MSDPSNTLAKSLAASNGEVATAGATPALAAYSTNLGDRTPQIVLMGAYGEILAPGTEVAAAWAGIDRSGGSVKDKTDEPSGQLGGTTQCAVATAGPAEMPVCLIERRREDIDTGLARLADSLARHKADDPETLADAVLSDLLPPGDAADDTALVIVRL